MPNTLIEMDLTAANTGQSANLEYRVLEDDGVTEHSTWTNTGIVEVDATDRPGYYRVQGQVDVPEKGGFIEVQNSVGPVFLGSDPVEPNVLTDTTYTELIGVPAFPVTIKDMLVWMFMLTRNKLLQTTSLQTLRDDGDSTDLATSATSSDGVTVTRGKWA